MNVQIAPLRSPAKSQQDSLTGRLLARKYLIGAAALAIALGGFWYFTHDTPEKAGPQMAGVSVRVEKVTRRTMPVIERTIGTVMANSTVQVNARVQGQLKQAFFKEGQMVRSGDLLFLIDPRPYQAVYDNATASLASAKAKADRYARLKGQNAISPQDADDAQASYLEAKATAESARLNLEFTHIISPVNGKTGPILIQPGNMVSSSTASTNATPLVTINEIQPVKVSFSLPQSDLPRIQARQKSQGLIATISLENGDVSLSAPVDFVSNSVNNLTGTIELRATFANRDLALVPGQLVNVTVELNSIPDAITVPHDAVNQGPEGTYVYSVVNDRAVLKPIKVLFDDTRMVAVEGKLAAGERVVVDGQLRVVPGTGVQVEQTSQTEEAPAPGRRRTS